MKLRPADLIFSRGEFCQKYNLNSDKKIVLILTQIKGFEPGEAVVRASLKTLKAFESRVETAIKPHPLDRERDYKKIIKKEKSRAVLVPKGSDVFEALYSCDILISVVSTAIFEALILDKIVITAKLGKYSPYTERLFKIIEKGGATISVKKESDIWYAVDIALGLASGLEMADKFKRARKKFLINIVDTKGNATERVVNLIKKMMK